MSQETQQFQIVTTQSIIKRHSITLYSEACVCFQQEKYQEAINKIDEATEQMVDEDSQYTKFLILKAKSYLYLKQSDNAITEVEKVLKIHPGNQEAISLKSQAETAKHPRKPSFTAGSQSSHQLSQDEIKKQIADLGIAASHKSFAKSTNSSDSSNAHIKIPDDLYTEMARLLPDDLYKEVEPLIESE